MPEHQQIQQSKKPDTIFQKQTTPVSQTPASNPYSIIQRAKINPKSLTHADVMQLQRTIGNRAVAQLLSGIVNSSTAHEAPIQRQEIQEEEEKPMQGKFETVQRSEIQEEGEPLQGKMVGIVQRQKIPEEEEPPMQGKFGSIQRQEIPPEEEKCPSCIQKQETPEEEEPFQGKMIEPVQRQETSEEEEPLQGKFEDKPEIVCPSCFAAPIVQKQESEEEEKPLQGKLIGTIQRQEIPEEKELLQTKKENNTGMPDNLKAGVENLSGIDMSDVKVHYNSSKPAEVGALAYTQGNNIHVSSGQERYLPHETWHVVQQAQGRVKPTMQMKDRVPVNNDERLEHEADAMGKKVSLMEKITNNLPSTQDRGRIDGAGAPVQCMRDQSTDPQTLRMLQAAQTVINQARQLIPYGAGNVYHDVVDSHAESTARFNLSRHFLRTVFGDVEALTGGQDAYRRAASAICAGGGACNEFSALTHALLTTVAPTPFPIIRVWDPHAHHSFTMIGDPRSTQATQIAVADAWPHFPQAATLADTRWTQNPFGLEFTTQTPLLSQQLADQNRVLLESLISQIPKRLSSNPTEGRSDPHGGRAPYETFDQYFQRTLHDPSGFLFNNDWSTQVEDYHRYSAFVPAPIMPPIAPFMPSVPALPPVVPEGDVEMTDA